MVNIQNLHHGIKTKDDKEIEQMLKIKESKLRKRKISIESDKQPVNIKIKHVKKPEPE